MRTAALGVLVLLALLPSACAAGGASQAGGGSASASRAESAGGAEKGLNPMVVKTAELGIRAEDVRASATAARRISGRFGGEVVSSRVEGRDGSLSANLVLSVPAGKFEAALDGLRGLGREVTTDSVKGQDVTGEFVDLGSRERNLLAAEKSLLRLYDKARSVEDTLKVQRELTDVRGQIEQVQGRMKYLRQSTDSSRITLSIEPVSSASRSGWDPALVVARAWDASLAVLRACATAVISVAVFCSWLVPALVAGLVWWRRRRASRPAGG